MKCCNFNLYSGALLTGMRFDKLSKIFSMSQAFVRESDEQWLHDISPTLNALIAYLTRENNGIGVYLKKTVSDRDGRETHLMSNGLVYAINKEGKWEIVW
jgi:hypothetical protein